jgi:hypothetical protein
LKFYGKVLMILMAGIITLVVIPFENAAGVRPAKAQEPNSQGPFVSEPVAPQLSRAVRELPTVAPTPPDNFRQINPRQLSPVGSANAPDEATPPDPLLRNAPAQSSLRTPAVITSFEGISSVTGGGGVPPDPNGDVGPNPLCPDGQYIFCDL